MFPSRLRSIAKKLSAQDLNCEYAATCKHFSKESETCINALDKTYCGAYNRILEGEIYE